MSDASTAPYLAALAMMEQTGPLDLRQTVSVAANGSTPEDVVQFCDRLQQAGPNDILRKVLHLQMAKWDCLGSDAAWTAGSPPNTQERRQLVAQRLQIDARTAGIFASLFPVAAIGGPIVIADKWEHWYTEEIRNGRSFYWKHYQRFLHERRGWASEFIASLDIATDRVVERLWDPTRPQAYQSKGLVVGYVQSGKTANFTGVVAKAIDAGYRLLIILTGTTDLLRAQTQRRLDMELVGRENILRGIDSHDLEALDAVDYQNDPEWLAGGFIEHGVRPADANMPDIHRLTTHAFDYRSLKQGIAALDFERRHRNMPFYDSSNLFSSDTRLLVVKKNASILEKLVKDLRKITARVGEIPALIIDDESDQASVNTSNPRKWTEEQKHRTAINRLISQLLRMLPRAQYVGYTATPFANVFIDPSDAEDIFPKDFLISLERPIDYMGASDFHDIDSEVPEPERTILNSSKKAHVRILVEDNKDKDATLLEAIDAFVLAGAMKLYREERDVAPFRHHTMLVHENMKTKVHKAQADRIAELWNAAAFYSPSSHERLRGLFDRDTRPVSVARGADLPIPTSFKELIPYISEAVGRITSGGRPALIVNSDKIEGEDLNFDTQAVWRILVGGNKLARGFTVEGLTVSYYRRVTKQADTLMQMGRWFGFRTNYRDLVRLYTTNELYNGFEAICRDEEHFRSELRRYSEFVDGEPQVTPKQIPPLVAQHLPWLKPTSPNKMYNAVLSERCSPGVGIEPTGYPDRGEQSAKNAAQFRALMSSANQQVRFLSGKTSYEAKVGVVMHSELMTVLGSLTWCSAEHFAADFRWLNRLTATQVSDWVIIFPQHVGDSGHRRMILGQGPFSLHTRKRRRAPYFGAISDPKHRVAAKRIAGIQVENPIADAELDRLLSPRRGAVLIYPVIEGEPEVGSATNEIPPGQVVMAFHLIAPGDTRAPNGRLVTFTARDRSRSAAPIIGVSKSGSSNSAASAGDGPRPRGKSAKRPSESRGRRIRKAGVESD